MTITVDPETALRAILKMFDGLGPDGVVAGDIDRVQISFACPAGSEHKTLVLYERSTCHGRPVISQDAVALMVCPFPPDLDL